MLVRSLLIFIEDLGVGAGYRFHACFFCIGEELCLLSRVALYVFIGTWPHVSPVGYTLTQISMIPGETHRTSPTFVPSGQ